MNAFLFGKNRQNVKVCGIKSDLSVNNDVFQTGHELKTFLRSTDWALKVHLAQSQKARLLAPGKSHYSAQDNARTALSLTKVASLSARYEAMTELRVSDYTI